jgi:hypothetical protein
MSFNANEGKQSFVASASQTIFTFNFKIFDEGDLKVYLTPSGQAPDDTADILTITTDYTVTINGDLGGDVTLVVPASVNDSIVVRRDLPKTRTITYVTQGDLLAVTLNTDQDYQTYLVLDQITALSEAITLPESTVGVSTKLPAVVASAYLRWAADGLSIENDTAIPQAAIDASDDALNAASYAVEAEDVFVKTYTAGVPSDTTDYSSFHWATKSQLRAWESEAEKLTADSYATQVEDTFVDSYSSDGDGTFTATPTTEYSALHWAAKASVFNPALYALLTGATFTGQVKGITPVAAEDLTRKDYVDLTRVLTTSVVQTEGQNWAGVTYTDPDAVGANPTAKIYPDGTVVGSTDNGDYIKYPNGRLVCSKSESIASLPITTGNIGGFRSSELTFTFPVLFTSQPDVSAESATNNALIHGFSIPTTALYEFVMWRVNSATTAIDYSVTAEGRWK